MTVNFDFLDAPDPLAPKPYGIEKDDTESALATRVSEAFLAGVVAAKLRDWNALAQDWVQHGWNGQAFRNEVSHSFQEVFSEVATGALVEGALHGHKTAQEDFTATLTPDERVITAWGQVYGSQQAARLALGSETAIQDIVTNGINSRLPANVIADRAKAAYGLDQRSNNTVMAYLTNKIMPKNQTLLEVMARALIQRSQLMADNEVFAALNFGRQLAYMDAVERGILDRTATKTWVTALDERVCPVCRPMDGVSVPIDQPFTVMMPLPKTGRGKNRKSAEFVVPPVHPLCRCTIVPTERLEYGIITRTARFDDDMFPRSHRARLLSDAGDLVFQKGLKFKGVEEAYRAGRTSPEIIREAVAAARAIPGRTTTHAEVAQALGMSSQSVKNAMTGTGRQYAPTASARANAIAAVAEYRKTRPQATYREIADHLGLSHQTLKNYMTGATPRNKDVVAGAKAYLEQNPAATSDEVASHLGITRAGLYDHLNRHGEVLGTRGPGVPLNPAHANARRHRDRLGRYTEEADVQKGLFDEGKHKRDEHGKFAHLAEGAAIGAAAGYLGYRSPVGQRVILHVLGESRYLSTLPRTARPMQSIHLPIRLMNGVPQGASDIRLRPLKNLADRAESNKRAAIFHPKAYAHLEGATHEETLRNVEEYIRHQDIEHGFVIAPSGKILSASHGNDHSVPVFLRAEQMSPLRGRLTYTHNHPDATGKDIVLSAQDMAALHGVGFNKIRAVTPRGVVTQIRVHPDVTKADSLDFATRAVGHAIDGQEEAVSKHFNLRRKGLFDSVIDFDNPEHMSFISQYQSKRMHEFYQAESKNGKFIYSVTQPKVADKAS